MAGADINFTSSRCRRCTSPLVEVELGVVPSTLDWGSVQSGGFEPPSLLVVERRSPVNKFNTSIVEPNGKQRRMHDSTLQTDMFLPDPPSIHRSTSVQRQQDHGQVEERMQGHRKHRRGDSAA